MFLGMWQELRKIKLGGCLRELGKGKNTSFMVKVGLQNLGSIESSGGPFTITQNNGRWSALLALVS